MKCLIIGLYFIISKADIGRIRAQTLPSKFRIALVTSATRIPVPSSCPKELQIYIVMTALLQGA